MALSPGELFIISQCSSRKQCLSAIGLGGGGHSFFFFLIKLKKQMKKRGELDMQNQSFSG